MLDELLPVAMDPQPSVADQMIAEEESLALAEALASLPEETREVLTLYYRERQSVAQVASLLEFERGSCQETALACQSILASQSAGSDQ